MDADTVLDWVQDALSSWQPAASFRIRFQSDSGVVLDCALPPADFRKCLARVRARMRYHASPERALALKTLFFQGCPQIHVQPGGRMLSLGGYGSVLRPLLVRQDQDLCFPDMPPEHQEEVRNILTPLAQELLPQTVFQVVYTPYVLSGMSQHQRLDLRARVPGLDQLTEIFVAQTPVFLSRVGEFAVVSSAYTPLMTWALPPS